MVLISSMAGLMGCYEYAGYCASKFGVIGLSDVLRIDRTGQYRISDIKKPQIIMICGF